MMKKLLCAVSLALAASAAQADIVSGNLTLAGDGTTPLLGTFNPSPGLGGVPATIYTGTLKANATGLFTATYLGQESGYSNIYVGGATLTEAVLGATATIAVNAGDVVNFGFKKASAASLFTNGTANTAVEGIGYFANAWGLKDANGRLFDWLIGYNDSARVDADYDDFIVGVVQTPVPAALPLMASALGLFGLSRRRGV